VNEDVIASDGSASRVRERFEWRHRSAAAHSGQVVLDVPDAASQGDIDRAIDGRVARVGDLIREAVGGVVARRFCSTSTQLNPLSKLVAENETSNRS
jgi:hypothetical protein